MNKWYIFLLITSSLFCSEYYYEYGKKIYVFAVKKARSLENNDIKTYKIGSKIVNFKNEIVVKLKENVEAKNFFQKYQICDYEKIAKNTYIIKLSKKDDLIKLSKEMYEDQDTIYALPNKIKKYKKR
jgi:hypothetical protein